MRKFGTRLQGHPQREHLPGIETTSGPLGSGLSQAVGMALAIRLDLEKAPLLGRGVGERVVYCLLGDGELNEGQNWEAIMLAGKEKLGNLICYVDRNNKQIDGFTENIMPLEPLDKKFEAFNFDVQIINGNNIEEIYNAVERAKATFNKPSVIICKTIPGKGVPEFEQDFHYHGYLQKKEDGEIAIKRLRNLGGQVDGHHN